MSTQSQSPPKKINLPPNKIERPLTVENNSTSQKQIVSPEKSFLLMVHVVRPERMGTAFPYTSKKLRENGVSTRYFLRNNFFYFNTIAINLVI